MLILCIEWHETNYKIMLRNIRKYASEKAANLIMKTLVLYYLDMGNCFSTAV